jgi:acetate kinase
MKQEFKSALQEQEQKIKQTVTELQLKENSIVTGDKTFEQKTVTTQDWINQLKNFKN